MRMEHLHVGDRVVLFERQPRPGRYIARTIKALNHKAGRLVLEGGGVVLARKVIAVGLR